MFKTETKQKSKQIIQLLMIQKLVVDTPIILKIIYRFEKSAKRSDSVHRRGNIWYSVCVLNGKTYSTNNELFLLFLFFFCSNTILSTMQMVQNRESYTIIK